MEIVGDVEAGRESGTLVSKVVEEGINPRHSVTVHGRDILFFHHLSSTVVF